MIVPHYITVLVQKYNENHDELGRFSEGDGPTIANQSDFDATPGESMYRGFGSQQYADEFMAGKPVVNARRYGTGIYTSSDKNMASSYAESNAPTLTMKLSPDANVGSLEAELPNYPGDKEHLDAKVDGKDFGDYMASKGFDAYTKNVDEDRYGNPLKNPITYTVIQNPSKVIVLDPSIPIVKGYYMTGPIRKDMLGDHIPQVIGTIPPIRPTGAVIRKPKAPKRAEVSVKKYNDNHDENGRFSEGDGGSKTAKYGSGIATPEMQAQINEHGKKAKDRLNEHPPRRAPFAPAIATQAMQDQINERGRTTVAARARMDERKATGVVIRKFNENHDELGRFSEGDGGVSAATASVHDTAVANEPAIAAQMQSLADKNGGTMNDALTGWLVNGDDELTPVDQSQAEKETAIS